MVSRREQLLARVNNSGPDSGNHPGDYSDNGTEEVGAEEGFPVGLLSGSRGLENPSFVEPLTSVRIVSPPDPKGRVDDIPAPSREKSSKPRGTASERQAEEIGDALTDKIVTVFAMLHGLAPVTSVYATQNSDKAVHALIAIGKRNPKILAILAKTANGVDALELGKFVLGIMVCIQVDTGRAKGDELPCRAFGVTEILEEHFWDAEEVVENPSVFVQQAPRFAAV